MIIRFFDIVFSLIGILILIPVFLFISVVLFLESGWPVIFVQTRVGRGEKEFKLFKFRSMHVNTSPAGLLTVGENDTRITGVGMVLRRFKLDELPQLFNVLNGTMSFVGPRPEVPKYTALYDGRQREVLKVRPGITDLASLEYIDENRLLGKADDPEKTYIEEIMPHKLEINLRYLESRTVFSDIAVIVKTVLRIFR